MFFRFNSDFKRPFRILKGHYTKFISVRSPFYHIKYKARYEAAENYVKETRGQEGAALVLDRALLPDGVNDDAFARQAKKA
jgi:hypothetical protein